MKQNLLENIELWLSALGLIVIWAVPAVLSPGGATVWRVATVTAVGVGLIHGVMFWFIRRRRERIRERSRSELETLNATLERRISERTAILAQSNEQVRSLASALTLAEQRERRRVSQVLHDQLQQILYGIQMRAQIVGSAGVPANVAEDVEVLNGLIGKAISTTRTIMVNLNPPVLKEDGFDAALRWLCLQMHELYGLEVELRVRRSCRIPDDDMRILLFQSVREILFNVVKHSGSNDAELDVDSDDDMVTVSVSDAGAGFDAEHVETYREQAGYSGLFSVRERLALFGGRLEVDTALGRGARLTLIAPARRVRAVA